MNYCAVFFFSRKTLITVIWLILTYRKICDCNFVWYTPLLHSLRYYWALNVWRNLSSVTEISRTSAPPECINYTSEQRIISLFPVPIMQFVTVLAARTVLNVFVSSSSQAVINLVDKSKSLWFKVSYYLTVIGQFKWCVEPFYVCNLMQSQAKNIRYSTRKKGYTLFQ